MEIDLDYNTSFYNVGKGNLDVFYNGNANVKTNHRV